MLRRLMVLVAGLVLVAGCGGGSDSEGDEPTAKPTPTPKAYTAQQLKAALPTVKDVPGGTKLVLKCPEDKDRCRGARSDGDLSVVIAVKPLSMIAMEIADPATDIAAVEVQPKKDAAAAHAALAKRRKADAVYDGGYATPDQKAGTTTIPGEKGTGSIADTEVGSFSGYTIDRTIGDVTSGRGDRAADVVLVVGTSVVSVFVRLSAGDRDDDAAIALARELATSYLERLG